MRTGCHYLISLPVRLSVCVTFVVFTDCESCTSRFPYTRDLWKRASMGERAGRVSSRAVSRWSRTPGCCGFRGVFWVGRDFFVFFVFFFFLRTHTACCKYEAPCLIYLSTSTIVEHFGDTFFLPQFRRIMVLQVQGSGYGLG